MLKHPENKSAATCAIKVIIHHNSLIKSYLKPNAKRHHAQCWLKYLPSFIAFRKDRSCLFQSCSALFAEGEQCKCLALQKTADLLDEQLKP